MATIFQEYLEGLYDESLRGAWEFESLKYGLMARLGLAEADALELACRIVVLGPRPRNAEGAQRRQPQVADAAKGPVLVRASDS